MHSFAVFSPAKINLFLAVTERRADGFHNLVSVVAPLAWGDSLSFESGDRKGEISVTCDMPEVPLDDSNLILKASKAFRLATGWEGGGVFRLTKRIPMGAGLGGGSSNASAALKALNLAAGSPLSDDALLSLSAGIGSDCPLFLSDRPLIMRGRGERIDVLPDSALKRISKRRVLVFKPSFGISTPWAYGQLAADAPRSYLRPAAAEERLANWLRNPEAVLEQLLFNNMERPAFRKYLVLPSLLESLNKDFGLVARMSGSGSACFVLLPQAMDIEPLCARIRTFLGVSAFIIETHLSGYA